MAVCDQWECVINVYFKTLSEALSSVCFQFDMFLIIHSPFK